MLSVSLLIAGLCVYICIGEAVADCLLPLHPAHGRHVPDPSDCGGTNKHPACEGTPGTSASEGWLLYVHCNPGYKLADPSASEVPSVCIDGSWSIPQLPRCVAPDVLSDEEQCIVPEAPPHTITELLAVECETEYAAPGLPVPRDCLIQLNCETGYQRSNSIKNDYFHCFNKTWNPPIPREVCIRDEDFNKGTTSPNNRPGSPLVPSDTGCVLPDSSPVRKYCPLTKDCKTCDNLSWKCHLPPGSRVDRVRVVCDHGYALKDSNTVAVCVDNGEWTPPIPECYKLCPPLKKEALSLKLECQYNNNKVPCSELSQPGTKASFRCRSGYSEIEELKRKNYYNKIITCNEEGEWSDSFPQCILNCGESNLEVSEFTPTIVDGLTANIGFFPWHAGLYLEVIDDGRKLWNYACGGSLISDRIVLTAAHCVVEIQDFRTLSIAVGKYYRSWYKQEKNEEKREVLNIVYPADYSDSLKEFDIALVILRTKIKFGQFIMPVCLEYEEETNELQNSKPYYVVGWGRTGPEINAKPSETLLYKSVRIGAKEECKKFLPRGSVVFDKICAVNTTESVAQPGDSGGGLTTVNKRGRHNIVGIVSSKVSRATLFTYISKHRPWLEDQIRLFSN